MKRRTPPPGRAGARAERVSGALARRSARREQIRVYDPRGHAEAIDPGSERGEAMLAAAREMLEAATRRRSAE